MFLENNFLEEYYEIIENAKKNKYDGYTEKHHIIPRSLGGDDNKDNLVDLTAEEHYLCHYLLTEITEGLSKLKMLRAWNFLNSTRDIDGFILLGPKRYAKLKKEYSNQLSKNCRRDKNFNAKVVLQISKDGEIIKEWACIKDANDKYPGADISACARGDQHTAAGFVWIFKNKFHPKILEEIQSNSFNIKGGNNPRSRAIYCIDPRNKNIKKFNSLTEASRDTGANINGIVAAASKKYKSAGGFIWRYEEDFNEKEIKDIDLETISRKGKNCHRSKKIYRLDKYGNILEEFDSATEALKKYKGAIRECCRGITKTAGGHYWCYAKNYKGKNNVKN